jgi:hypothetical protein
MAAYDAAASRRRRAAGPRAPPRRPGAVEAASRSSHQRDNLFREPRSRVRHARGCAPAGLARATPDAVFRFQAAATARDAGPDCPIRRPAGSCPLARRTGARGGRAPRPATYVRRGAPPAADPARARRRARRRPRWRGARLAAGPTRGLVSRDDAYARVRGLIALARLDAGRGWSPRMPCSHRHPGPQVRARSAWGVHPNARDAHRGTTRP